MIELLTYRRSQMILNLGNNYLESYNLPLYKDQLIYKINKVHMNDAYDCFCFLTDWFGHCFTSKVIDVEALEEFILWSRKLC